MLQVTRLAFVFLAINIVLFLAKLVVGIISNSLAILSDAFNSLIDVVSAVMIYVAVRVASQPADVGHPFGHSRAEPIAAFTVAVLTLVLAFGVARTAVERIFLDTELYFGVPPIVLLIVVIFTKSLMWFVAARFVRHKTSPAFAAVVVDSKMDVVVSLLALVGVVVVNFGYSQFDAYVALIIAAWIARVGFELGRENLKKLMGQCPDPATMQQIRNVLQQLKRRKRIRNFHDLRVHFVGTEIHVAVHIELPRTCKFERVNLLEEEVQTVLKRVDGVAEAAVHADPI